MASRPLTCTSTSPPATTSPWPTRKARPRPTPPRPPSRSSGRTSRPTRWPSTIGGSGSGQWCSTRTPRRGPAAASPTTRSWQLGGDGIRLKHCQPLLLDDVAADFPELTIIGAHPSWPWQDEMLAIARHKANVYIDLSGWAPKYFAPALVQQMNSLLQDKCLFGSDFPVIPTERWLKDFADLPIEDAVRPKILYGNAARILGLPA
ncbi:MAG: amidohydrolase [Chloroflexi bacterium]|nr:amidohydrolase [Chloroflexota bacterium]